ncbi:Molybdopterin-guanine dinucleotide biosynthesis adapter protein [Paraburkholderia kirstenboschensis]|uniref:molybdopterin-guanine dinucleotide biosynthesis protein B n=1 Tax=Paraburkholderia kirstenboschensis TaxID=1245436 RepID=UPI0013E36863|nr:molybdopterin-guanine dinucleotide biosynthesis protein B [Paraburkholderia kirstenboschensis]CAD6561513.1 Molybdopterin-guanine dinucleotide biosynthesis adapter protein [Paraburkholderia kirstenboschensis]
MRVIGLVGWSGAGKTTLIAKLIPELKTRGIRTSTVKHAHHNFDIDHQGKDSFVHRQAGANEVLVASRKRWALIHEMPYERDPQLKELLPLLTEVDVILIEGFKSEAHVKLEIFREANGSPWMYPGDDDIVAVISDRCDLVSLQHAHIDDVCAVADLVLRYALPMDQTLARLASSGHGTGDLE